MTMPQQTEIVKTIEDLERRRYQAMVQGDIATLEGMFGDDLLYIHSNAVGDTKDEYVGALKARKYAYTKAAPEHTRIRVYGDNVAVVSGRIKLDLEVDGKPKQLDNLYVNIWAKDQSGRWRFVSWQSTPVPH